jgi:hypothetical protein
MMPLLAGALAKWLKEAPPLTPITTSETSYPSCAIVVDIPHTNRHIIKRYFLIISEILCKDNQFN